jgi:small subunit ribosomal protein S1
MEDRSDSQEIPPHDREWWTSLDEEYWQALMEHGENPPEAVPPAPAQEMFQLLGLETGTRTSTTGPATPGDTAPQSGGKWQTAQLALDQGDLFCLRVAGANRGGLLVEWDGLQGFVPASHLVDMPRYQDPHERMSSLADRIGEALTLRMIEVDVGQQRLVFSERAATSGSGSTLSLLNTLRPGDVCQGTVTNLTTFGAFVDLGGIEGLIHISEISWDRVRHPGDALRPGQEIDVYVVGVNPKERRIALSLKRLRPDPWAKVDSHYQVGEIVEGTVTNVVSFGAFVRVEEGLEGLIHISELAEGSFMHPRSVVREGDTVQVRVLNINKNDHRLGLSLRQAHGPMSVASGRGLEHGPPA